MKTERDYYFDIIKKKGDIEFRSSVSGTINEEDFTKAMQEYAQQFNKPNLGMAKTSELIYELSARCDTGSIDKGGDYKTIDNN